MKTAKQNRKPHPCLVAGCTGYIEAHGFSCARCWNRLPEGTQLVLPRIIEKRRAESREEIIGQALARLGAELGAEKQGPLWTSEFQEAHELTPQVTGFKSFEALLNAGGGYWPHVRVLDASDPQDYQRRCRLADLYDHAQAARGDKRRATRLGFCGL